MLPAHSAQVLTMLTSSTFCSNSAKLFLTASRRRNPLVSGLASTWNTIQMSESVMSRPSLSHLLQQHLQSRLDDLQVPAVLACHILQSCLQHHLLKVLKIISMNKYWGSNTKLFSMVQCLLTISNSSNQFSYLEKLEHIPGIEHFSDGVVSLLYHHWSY